MKKFTKFSVVTIAMLGLSSPVFAISAIELGTGGVTTTVGTANAISLNASGGGPVPAVPANTVNIFAPAGTFISDDVTVGGVIYGDNNPYNSLNLNTSFYDVTLQAEDDLFLNADSTGFGYGGVVLQKNGTTLARFDENSDGGTNIYTDTFINTGGTFMDPSTASLGLESGVGAGIGYTNSLGNLHGLWTDETHTEISGGTNSSTWNLADGDAGGATLTVGGSDIMTIDQTVFSATSDAFGYNSVVTVGSNVSDSNTVVQSGGAELNLGVQNASLSADNNIVLTANTDGGASGAVIIDKQGYSTLMSIDDNSHFGTQIFTTTTMYDDLDMTGNQIHGLAPGTAGTDAVNLNQLNDIENDMSKGIAATTAIANIPQVEAGKKASVGLGYGHYNGENAIAAGASWHFGAQSDGIMKVSVGTGGSGETAVGAGASWSW